MAGRPAPAARVLLRSREGLVDVLNAAGLSDRALARAAGLSHSTVNHLVSGFRKSCSEPTARAIEAALGCQPGALFRPLPEVASR